MYTKEEREGILWEYHRSGMSVPEACRLSPVDIQLELRVILIAS